MSILIRQGGVWKEPDDFHVKNGGVWKPADVIWVRHEGLWREVYTSTTLITTSLSSGKWVCPPRTTNIVSMVGRGGRGKAASSTTTWADSTPYVVSLTASAPAGYSVASIKSFATTEWNKFPSTYTSSGKVVLYNRRDYYNNVVNVRVGAGSGKTWRVKQGLTKTKQSSGWSLTSGTTPGPVGNFYVGNLQNATVTSTSATRGASTTGFGQTFTGGSGNVLGTARTVTNIAVVPGQSYSISLGSGGSLSITYWG